MLVCGVYMYVCVCVFAHFYIHVASYHSIELGTCNPFVFSLDHAYPQVADRNTAGGH